MDARMEVFHRMRQVWPDVISNDTAAVPSLDEIAEVFANISQTNATEEQVRLRLTRRMLEAGLLERDSAICHLAQREIFVVNDPAATSGQVCAIPLALASDALLRPPTLNEMSAKYGYDQPIPPINLTHLGEVDASPLHILRLVQYRNGRSMGGLIDSHYAWRGQSASGAVNEAALIHRLACPMLYSNTLDEDFERISARYTLQLRDELRWLQLGAQLIPSAPAADGMSIWFDGVALRGASGMDFDKLVKQLQSHYAQRVEARTEPEPEAENSTMASGSSLAQPDGRVSPEEIRLAVMSYLEELAENDSFTYGTVLHSVATTVLRLGPYHGMHHEEMKRPVQAVCAFIKLRRAWLANPRFPIDPLTVASHHCDLTRRGRNDPPSGRSTRALNVVDESAFARRLMAYAPWPAPEITRADASVEWNFVPPESSFAPIIPIELLRKNGKPASPSAATSPRAVLVDGQALTSSMQVKAEELIRLHNIKPDNRTSNELATILRTEVQRLRATQEKDDSIEAHLINASKRFIESLVFDTPVAHVVKAISNQDYKAVLEIVPFVMPTYEIEEGLRTGNTTRVRDGAIRFGVDALFVWLTGVAERSFTKLLKFNGEPMRMPSYERVAVNTLSRVGSEIESFEMQALDSLQHEHIRVDPYEVINDPTTVPKSYREMPVPRRISAASDRTSLTPYDAEWTRTSRSSSSSSRVSSGGASPLFGVSRWPSRGLTERDTVVDTKKIFSESTTFLGVLQGLGCSVYPTSERLLNSADSIRMLCTSTSADGEEMIRDLEYLHARSPILQGLVQQALDADLAPLAINIVDGEAPRYAPSMHALIFPPESQLLRFQYESLTGKQGFLRERAILHEFLHAMTSMTDPVTAGHRGAIVYLTDRIGHQAGRDWPERIVYRAFERDGVTEPSAVAQSRSEAIRWMHEENEWLDEELRKKLGVSQHLFVAGEGVTLRRTVIDAERMFTMRDRGYFLNAAQMKSTINFRPISEDVPPNIMSELTSLIRQFNRRQLGFCEFLDIWLFNNADRVWEVGIETRPPPLAAGEPFAEVPWHINRQRAVIEINTSPLYCLTASGPRLLTTEQRYAGMLIDLITEGIDIRDVTSPASERGLKVYMENLLLSQSPADMRVAAALSHDPNVLSPYLTQARRAALDEDVFLTHLLALKNAD